MRILTILFLTGFLTAHADPFNLMPFCAARRLPAPASSKVPARALSTKNQLPPADTLTEPTVIDALFLYTPAALAGAGSEAGINARIDRALDDANYRYTNSLINIRLNLVYRGLVNYTESGSMEVDWETLEAYRPRGSLSRAATLREDYKADIVYLLTETDNYGYGGISFIASAGGDADHAYGVVLRSNMGPIVLAHEVGHLLGAQHDREHAYDTSGEIYGGAYPYSYGYRFEADGITYVTTMAYQPGIYVPYFSNPNILFSGVAMGIPEGQPGAADNARTMNQLAPYVASYRTALSRMEFTAATFESSEANDSAHLSLHRTGDISSATRVTLEFESDSTAKAGVDYQKPASLLIAFAAGQDSAEVVIPLLENTRIDGDRVLHLSLASPLGQHGIGLQGTTRLLIHDDEPAVAFDSPVTYVSEAAVISGFVGDIGHGGAIPVFIVRHIDVPISFVGDFGSSDKIELPILLLQENDTAKAGEDFNIDEAPLIFTPVERHQRIGISILDNAISQSDRIFHIKVGNATNEVHILDDDRDGSADVAFANGLGIDGVSGIIPLPDGRLLITGGFTNVGSVPASGIARLKSDGSLDETFHPAKIRSSLVTLRGIQDASIQKAAIQPDGKILIAGIFSEVENQRRTSLARLNADGTLDQSFNPQFSVDGSLQTLLLQGDGRIVIGGIFEHVNGIPRSSFARLQPDGTLDTSLRDKPIFSSIFIVVVSALAEDAAGRILVGGQFQGVNGSKQTNLVRLTLDGAIDTTFNVKGGASGPVTRIVPLANGQVLVGGLFDIVSGQAYKKIARLNVNGSVDATFRPSPAPNSDINDLMVLNDGRVLVAGSFSKAGSAKTPYLTLFRTNGTVDPSFDPGTGPGDYCFGVAIAGDGSLYVSGIFSQFNHQPVSGLARLRFSAALPKLALTRSEDPETWQLQLSAYPGAYQLESSADLVHWNFVQALDSAQTIPIPKPLSAKQFYRVEIR